MDPVTAAAFINAGSRVLGSLAAADAGPVTSGVTNTGFFGMGNEGMTVNFGGSGLNLQGGATGSVPMWLLAAAAAVFLLVNK